jgi:hypothetical protein
MEFGPSAVEYESAVVICPWSLFRRYVQASNFGAIAQHSQSPLTLAAIDSILTNAKYA